MKQFIADHAGSLALEQVVEIGNFEDCAPEWVQPFFCLIGYRVGRH